MSVSDFKAKLAGGGSRANQFEVEIGFPAFAGGANEIEDGLFLCKSAVLPASTLGVIEVPFRGRVLPLPGDRTFDEWTATFHNATNFNLRNAFERWQNAIDNIESTGGLTDPDDYMMDIQVHQLDKQGKRIKTYGLVAAWPTIVGEIELSTDSSDTIEEFPVTFRYVNFESDTTS